LVLTLSGVLKDILLVVLSVIIWSTPVSALQMFGYAIALGGLIYYKIGGDQAHAAYVKLTSDENSILNRFKRSFWAKVGAGVLVLFVVLAMAHGFTRGGIDTKSSLTGLSGAPEPEMGAARGSTPVVTHGGHDTYADWDEHSSPMTHIPEKTNSDHPLDIVIYMPARTGSLEDYQGLLSIPGVGILNPHVIAYTDADVSEGMVNQVVPLGQHIKSSSAAFLHYIHTHYNVLADHTVFLHADVDVQHIRSVVGERFKQTTGVLELSQGGYGVCNCLDCIDQFHGARTKLSKTDELYALTSQNACTRTDQLLVLPQTTLLTIVERRCVVHCILGAHSQEFKGGVRSLVKFDWRWT
jgi:hypothetical protein